MINEDRARELFDAYGGKPANWPAEYRADLIEFCERSEDGKRYLRGASELDALLDSYQPEVLDMTHRVLQAAPVPMAERLLAWMLPGRLLDCWRPAMVAACPLLIGLAIGIQYDVGNAAGQQGLNDWDATELALLTPAAQGEWYE